MSYSTTKVHNKYEELAMRSYGLAVSFRTEFRTAKDDLSESMTTAAYSIINRAD